MKTHKHLRFQLTLKYSIALAENCETMSQSSSKAVALKRRIGVKIAPYYAT